MASHKIHKLVNKIFLGNEYEDVNKWMDEPFSYLGRRHRVLRHDPLSIALKYCDDPKRTCAGLLHILVDEVSSKRKWKRRSKR